MNVQIEQQPAFEKESVEWKLLRNYFRALKEVWKVESEDVYFSHAIATMQQFFEANKNLGGKEFDEKFVLDLTIASLNLIDRKEKALKSESMQTQETCESRGMEEDCHER